MKVWYFFTSCQHGKHTLLVWEQNNWAGYKMTQLTEYEMTVGKKWSVIYSIAILKSWWLHRIFLHLHHSYDSLFSTRVESYSLLGRCVSDVLGCLWLLSNLGGLCCSNFCCNFFFQSFSCFPGCLKLIHFRKNKLIEYKILRDPWNNADKFINPKSIERMLKKGIRQLTMLSVKTNFHEILLRGKHTYLFFFILMTTPTKNRQIL